MLYEANLQINGYVHRHFLTLSFVIGISITHTFIHSHFLHLHPSTHSSPINPIIHPPLHPYFNPSIHSFFIHPPTFWNLHQSTHSSFIHPPYSTFLFHQGTSVSDITVITLRFQDRNGLDMYDFPHDYIALIKLQAFHFL